MFGRSKKTEIVLTQGNLTALLTAIEVMKQCFGQDLAVRHSTIRREDDDSDPEVTLLARVPMRAGDAESSLTLSAVVLVTAVGFCEIEVTNGARLKDDQKLVLIKMHGSGAYVLTEDSRLVLEEFRERARPYRKD